MKETQAEMIALSAFSWLSSDPERAGGFLGVSGASVEDLRVRARDPEFLGFVLDYILMDDQNVMACAHEIGLEADQLMQARQVLPGGMIPDWT